MTTALASLFIDQPVGVGFSYGTLDVGTSIEAAEDVWSVSLTGETLSISPGI